MTTYNSKEIIVKSDKKEVYNKLSDLNNIEKYRDKLPAEFTEELKCDTDSAHVNIPNIGKTTLRIIERNPDNIKFALENIPIKADMVFHLNDSNINNTNLRIALNADIPIFLKPMIGNKLQEGIDMIADTFAIALSTSN